ncbi:MAG: GyrI-like domain-containing protein [Candidatus Hydrogenedentes bacterium]|nr:GyrI-like domain-containing protein [Candidatus Hydrogenedentota bacterium]
MDAIDFVKTLKTLYTGSHTAEEVCVDSGTFLAVEGEGEPGGTAFVEAIQIMYAAVYTLKFAVKHEGRVDFKVCKLEALWFSDPAVTPRSQWRWRLLVRVPDAITSKDLAATRKTLMERKGIDATTVKRVTWKEGRAVQLLHVGPYDGLPDTYARLAAFAEERGLAVSCPGHEIYLSDPRATAPEKLRTLVRMPVKRRK